MLNYLNQLNYFIELIITTMPFFIMASISLMPLLIWFALILNKFKVGNTIEYNHITASTTYGIIILLLLGSSLFGDSLSKSSTAGLIFFFAPFPALFISLSSYAITYGIFKKIKKKISIKYIFIPLLISIILLVGIINCAFADGAGDIHIAEFSNNASALHYVFNKTLSADNENVDKFGILLFLSQNHNTPTDIFEIMANPEYSEYHNYMKFNPNLSSEVRKKISND